MDIKTQEVLKIINSHLRIKKFLTILCYFLIVGGMFVYLFAAINKSKTITVVKQIQDNMNNFQTRKVMTNPRIDYQHNDNQIYHIKAREASHKDENEVIMYDVFASGKIGDITAGELKIDEEGDHLVFTKNPVLILKQTNQ